MKRGKFGQFTSEGMRGRNNPRWKGDNVGYFGLHMWVQRVLGKAVKCEECGSSKWVQWANISRKYKRRLSDWKQLCSVHHRRFDGITKFSKKEAENIRKRYFSGEKQRAIAKRLGVDQGTISNIVLHKIKFYG